MKRKKLPENLSELTKSALSQDLDTLDRVIAEYRTTALDAANQGDFEELKSLLRDGRPLNEDERNFLVKVLDEATRNRGRPRDLQAEEYAALAFYWLHEAEQRPRGSMQIAYGELAKVSRKGDRWVKELVKKGRKHERVRGAVNSYKVLAALKDRTAIEHFKQRDISNFSRYFRDMK